MIQPLQKSEGNNYQSLEDIQARKDELLEQINADNSEFGTKWEQLFTAKESGSKAEFIGGLIANSITALDAFLLVRKLMKNYGGLFGLRKRRRK